MSTSSCLAFSNRSPRIADRFAVLTGLSQEQARALPGQQIGVHERPAGAYLTGVQPKWTDGSDFRNGISFDQIIAREIGKHTQLTSLEVSLDSAGISAACERGWNCAYINTLCCRVPRRRSPWSTIRARVFERLFGDLQEPRTRKSSVPASDAIAASSTR